MPGFPDMGTRNITDLVEFLFTGKDKATDPALMNDPARLKYRSDGESIFLDPDGYPAITPPWGTLNAIDLNTGAMRWKIPLGEVPEIAAKGLKNTGSDNYGGPVVTAGGVVFIAATNFDKKFRAFDKLTGKLLWETTLPAAGNATPPFISSAAVNTSSLSAAAARTARHRAARLSRFRSAGDSRADGIIKGWLS
jgi:quinoprotein glucose dehydrogenase